VVSGRNAEHPDHQHRRLLLAGIDARQHGGSGE
jgi:hypothetical protein